MAGTSIYNWDELPEDTSFGVFKRAVQGGAGSVKRIEVPAGCVGERHSHAHEQFVIVLDGSGTLSCDAGDIKLRPGTVIHFAPNAWHSTVFDTKTLLMEVNFGA